VTVSVVTPGRYRSTSAPHGHERQTAAVPSAVDRHLPVIDVAPLLAAGGGTPIAVEAVAQEVDRACRDWGFFLLVGHGAPEGALERLDAAARRTFALPEEEKAAIAMAAGGRAWRGWFPEGGELTSGIADRKEGLYLGTDLPPTHERVRAGTPMHGPNLYPASVPELRPAVEAWMAAMRRVGDALVRAIGTGLGLGPDWFHQHLTADPVELFRIFRYPAAPVAPVAPDEAWGVGEHTDYGLLTLLAHDGSPGLQVRGPHGWIDVPVVPGSVVVNLGDWLEALSEGAYRSTPHRVRPPAPGAADRLSFPYFFDPGWDARVPGQDATYGSYLLAKVSAVFPELSDQVLRPPG
jgi:isopenicillin N synthase-like dioxygenase